VVTFAEELFGKQNESIQSLALQTFISANMAFFAKVLRKENMASSWSPWCTLSKLQWGPDDHEKGKQWTIKKLYNIRHMLKLNNKAEIPENIKEVKARLLFDAVPVSNYILCILHIVIVVGNNLVDTLMEWIEKRWRNSYWRKYLPEMQFFMLRQSWN
jgi:hypothetical protein